MMHGTSSTSRHLAGPEHREVRIPLVESLVEAGWHRDQIQWSPEWRVPKSPHDAAARERGGSFASWPVDLALFDSPSHAGDWQHVTALFELKAPNKTEGVSQLEIYLAREPRAKMGYWTDGTTNIRVLKLPDGNFVHRVGEGPPLPGESFERPSREPLTFRDLRVPSTAELRSVFRRLLDAVVASDSRATRSEVQLNELCNLLLLKLESDYNGQFQPDSALSFQIIHSDTPEQVTASRMHADFDLLVKLRPQVFNESDGRRLMLDDHTIVDAVYELSGLNLVRVSPESISTAFQVFRRANLKAGEGQYFTPQRVIEAAVSLMDLRADDKIIDPACGTGGFLVDAFVSISNAAKSSGDMNEAMARTWAHRQIFGVDKDAINVKLARALMISLGDGSINIHTGDSVRKDRWPADYPHLQAPLADGAFTVVLTNPPFGQGLKVSEGDARRNSYSIAKRPDGRYRSLEIGLIFLERAYELLMPGGRLGIILPETYFFSSTYDWLPAWLNNRLLLRGMLNIPMEAFQGFCRAKTNFYVFEKVA